MNVEMIKSLCAAWRSSIVNPEGGYKMDKDSYSHELCRNGIVFHQLSFEELCVALSELSISSFLKSASLAEGENKYSMTVNADHLLLWGWCAQMNLLLPPAIEREEKDECSQKNDRLNDPYKSDVDAELKQLMRGIINALINHDSSKNVSNFSLNFDSLLMAKYMAFPLLEGMLKQALSNYVSESGEVIKEINAGKGLKFKPTDQINSLQVYLCIWIYFLPDGIVKTSANNIMRHIKDVSGKKYGTRTVYEWRNSCLHGGFTPQPVLGILLGLIFLIQLFTIENEFEDKRQRCAFIAEAVEMRGDRTQFDFYPFYVPPFDYDAHLDRRKFL